LPVTDLPLLIDAAYASAKIALKYWKTDQRVDTKDGGSPVSEADYAVDTYLRETLLAARPDYGWLSEETDDDKVRLGHDTVFVVDPIDGTRAFVGHESTWAHSIAVVQNGQPTAGVVFLPARDKIYSAALGQGARLNGAPITAGTNQTLHGATALCPKPSLDPQWWAKTPPKLERHFRPSLAYRFCLVAEGRFDIMLTLRDAWEWDIAAGTLIATEAGANVTDRNGAALNFNSDAAKSKGVFTANPTLHRALLGQYL